MVACRTSLIVLMILSANAGIRAGDNSDEFAELAQTLLSSIRNDDIVEYSSCWLSFRAARAAAPRRAKDSAESKIGTREREYVRNRNKNIARSFEVIQSVIRQQEIDRRSITLVSVEAAIRERSGIKRADDFTFIFTTSAGKMRLTIDDGVLVGGLWYFTDSPTALEIPGQKEIRFGKLGKR